MTEETVLEGHKISITTSIGISLYPTDAQDRSTLIKLADAAMYRAKTTGKNLYEFSRED
ncbi:MAG: diguanylate cyclase [Planktothrix sp.]